MKLKRSVWKLVSIGHLGEIKGEMGSRVRDGLLDKTLYQTYLGDFTIDLPLEARGAQSIIIAATPQPMVRLVFHYGGKPLGVIVPPTYFDSDLVAQEVKSQLAAVYGEGSRFIRAFLPLKLIAVRSGLARYGRNNITYMPEYGSFFRLTSFFSNVAPDEDHWHEEQMLEECRDCWICTKACPAGVLSEDRFMARAERCLTYLNEKPPAESFPAWVEPAWHNAIIGCMICQRVCPANRGVISQIEDRGEFSEGETAYLLNGDFTKEDLTVSRKLTAAGLDLSIFPRNLKVLLKRD